MLCKKYAQTALNKLDDVNLPVDVYEIAKADGITIKEVEAEGFEGILIVQNDQGVIGVNQNIRESTRKRFTIAHELGHFYLPNHLTDSKLSFACTRDDVNNYNDKAGKECEANQFAVELLMPEMFFRKKIKNKELSYDLLACLSDTFQTSLTATSIRYVNYNQDYALIFSTSGVIKWFNKGKSFPYFISPGKLSDDSYAKDFYKQDKIPKTFQAVPANAWVDNVSSDKEVQELSIPLTYYNSVITFLYAEYEEEEDEEIEEMDGYLKFK